MGSIIHLEQVFMCTHNESTNFHWMKKFPLQATAKCDLVLLSPQAKFLKPAWHMNISKHEADQWMEVQNPSGTHASFWP